MLNSSVIFNNLYIANVMIFTIKIKKFSLYVSLLFHKRYLKGGRDTEQQFHRAWYMQFPLLMYMETAYLFSYH